MCSQLLERSIYVVPSKAADTGNIKGVFDGIKTAIGPRVNKSAPIKSESERPITDKTKQLERWVEHYSEMYATENKVHQSVLDEIELQ